MTIGALVYASLETRRAAFPLNELLIAAVLIGLVAAGLFFYGGAWGMALLWAAGGLVLLPLVAAPIGVLVEGKRKFGEGRRAPAAAWLLGGALLAAAWLAAVGYCAVAAYRALP